SVRTGVPPPPPSSSSSSFSWALASSPDGAAELPSGAESPNDDEKKSKKSPKGGGGGRRRNPIRALRRLLLALVVRVATLPSRLRGRYSQLSGRGRILFLTQVLAFGALLGLGASRVADVRNKGAAATRPVEVGYSTFLDLVDASGTGHAPGRNPALKLESVVISKDRVGFRVASDDDAHAEALLDKKLVASDDVSVRPVPANRRSLYALRPPAPQELLDRLRERRVPFRAASTAGANNLATLARASIFVIYVLFLGRMYRAMGGGGGGGGGAGGMSGAPGKLATFSAEDGPMVTFEDIEGIDDAKFEVMELVDALRNPKKYEILGARAPTGLLLEGPPGTGKTMLARATAATAGVPLLYCSGSDFVEMFVGRGAARVRNTFARAAKLSPCIVFIDELDALGKSRDMGGLGASMRGNDEAEQTLNQLLACMDGLDSSRRVCVLAATNRREVLDPALIRPGRFDRIIKVTLPNVEGRERILKVHAKKLPGFTECTGVDEKRPGR
ncbi:hypothetical protein ACHAWF_010733, partial [Thalassiosira exigua]